MPQRFDPTSYGREVEAILAIGESGERLMPLAIEGPVSPESRHRLQSTSAADLFPDAPHPDAALAGLWLYFSCFEESHSLAQDIYTPEGSFWHGILHRQEPDPGNAGYWFRRVRSHPVFTPLREAAEEILNLHPTVTDLNLKSEWDPFAFIDFCESARRRAGSQEELVARKIQRAEWQLLFDHCARRQS